MMDKPIILVLMRTDEEQKAQLEAAANGAELIWLPDREVTDELLGTVDAVIGNLNPAQLKNARRLRWIQLGSAGADGYTEKGALPEGAVLTNASGAYGLAISEHMVACLLFLMKKLDRYAADQATHTWQDRGPVSSIWNSRTMVVGLGDIGGEFARRMHALGSRVTGIRRHDAPKPDYLEALCRMDRFFDCLGEADIVASCLPGTRETYRLYDAKAFAAMKEGAYFLNVGRGSSVDSLALADALNSGHLAGASVDVTDPEPLPPEHPLWSAKNILVTPHISGGDHLRETKNRIIGIAADNLGRFVSGRPLRNVVDCVAGYRRFEG